MTPLFIDWTPSVEVFTLGSFSLRWYSLLWCVGLLLAYLIVQRLYVRQGIGKEKFEPLFLYCFIGVIAGARLGHCLFYEPQYYLTSATGFIEMLIPFHKMHDGSWAFTGYEGLASHGGTIGLFVALVLYWRRHDLHPMTVLDNIALATPATAACIRLGNLMNAEIVGKVTDVPWAFLFHSREALVGGEVVPRHPAQLYEALAYLLIFAVQIAIYRRGQKTSPRGESSMVGSGFFFGFCLAAIFTFRFFVEFVKKEQSAFEQGMPLDMGQLLSIPFIIIGVWCVVRALKTKPA